MFPTESSTGSQLEVQYLPNIMPIPHNTQYFPSKMKRSIDEQRVNPRYKSMKKGRLKRGAKYNPGLVFDPMRNKIIWPSRARLSTQSAQLIVQSTSPAFAEFSESTAETTRVGTSPKMDGFSTTSILPQESVRRSSSVATDRLNYDIAATLSSSTSSRNFRSLFRYGCIRDMNFF